MQKKKYPRVGNPLSFLFASILILLSLSGCKSTTVENKEQAGKLRYASLLTMEENDRFAQVTVRNPWKPEETLARYVLVSADQTLPDSLPEGIVLRTPLQRVGLTSSVHASLLKELDAGKRVCGLTDMQYVVGPSLRAYLQENEVADLGSSMSPDFERLRAANIDALLVSPYEGGATNGLERLGVPLVQCADYMETSPLGRAEWMRFYGRLVGEGARADSLFLVVENEYNALKEQATQTDSAARPTVFCDLPMNGTWYEPGGESTMGILLQDAGSRYLWADERVSGSLSLDMEAVYARAHAADVWLIKYGAASDLTFGQMQRDNAAYARFDAYQQGRVWVCNTFRVPFFEDEPFHPERLLRELVRIFQNKETEKNVYFTPIQK